MGVMAKSAKKTWSRGQGRLDNIGREVEENTPRRLPPALEEEEGI